MKVIKIEGAYNYQHFWTKVEKCSLNYLDINSIDGHHLFSSLSGVSIDLVCLAEQPLHTVPLLKYFNKMLGKRDGNLADDYNIPHWMNHNFYASSKTRNKGEAYVPQIKVPEVMLNSVGRRSGDGKG